MESKQTRPFSLHIQRYMLTGILTIIPVWITWLVFDFFFTRLSELGRPLVRFLSDLLQQQSPTVSSWLLAPWFQSVLAILFTLLALYTLGWIAHRVIGKRLLGLFDQLVNRIPFIQSVYGSIKKLLSALQQKPDSTQRVVLIEFPSKDMKTVGFVTRELTDKHTGQKLAAVYVPTTPNPTSGYLEVVPLDKLVSTNWSIDEAMSFIISGGAVAPDKINYSQND